SGNDFSGSVDGRYRNENFYEKGDHFDPDEFDITREIYELTFGGPILKDKVWFFLAGAKTKSDFAGQGFNAGSQFHGYNSLGKLAWQAAANHKFILQVTGDPATIDNSNAGPLTAAEASSMQEQGSNFVTAQYQGSFGPSWIVNVQAAHYKSKLDVSP